MIAPFRCFTVKKFYQTKKGQLYSLAVSLIIVAVVFSVVNTSCNATIVVDIRGHPKVSYSANINGRPVEECGKSTIEKVFNVKYRCMSRKVTITQKEKILPKGECGMTIWDHRLGIHGGADVKLECGPKNLSSLTPIILKFDVMIFTSVHLYLVNP